LKFEIYKNAPCSYRCFPLFAKEGDRGGVGE